MHFICSCPTKFYFLSPLQLDIADCRLSCGIISGYMLGNIETLYFACLDFNLFQSYKIKIKEECQKGKCFVKRINILYIIFLSLVLIRAFVSTMSLSSATEVLRTRTEVHKRRFLEQMQEKWSTKKENQQDKTRVEYDFKVQRMRLVKSGLVKSLRSVLQWYEKVWGKKCWV